MRWLIIISALILSVALASYFFVFKEEFEPSLFIPNTAEGYSYVSLGGESLPSIIDTTSLSKEYDPVKDEINIIKDSIPLIRLQLIENTEYCLTDCYSIINISYLAKPVTVSDGTSDYFLSYISKDYATLQSLEYKLLKLNDCYYTRPVWEDYIDEEIVMDDNKTLESHTVKIAKKRIIGYDQIRYDCYEETELLGSEIKQGDHIKISGRKTAKLGENNVDWKMRFYAIDIDEWAWWNSSCLNKINVNATISVTEPNQQIFIGLDTTGVNWTNYTGLYVIDTDGDSSLKWWNETAFNNINTSIVFNQSVTSGTTKVYDIYYNCGHIILSYNSSDVFLPITDDPLFGAAGRWETQAEIDAWPAAGTSGTWTLNTTEYTEGIGSMRASAIGDHRHWRDINYTYNNATLRMDFWIDGNTTTAASTGYFDYADTDYAPYYGLGYAKDASVDNYSYYNGAWVATDIPLVLGEWNRFEFKVNDTGTFWLINKTQVFTTGDTVSYTIIMFGANLDTPSYPIFDNFIIYRDYSDLNPILSYGLDEGISAGNPVSLPNVQITPSPAYTNDSLNCSVDYTHSGGDPANITFTWYNNSVAIHAFDYEELNAASATTVYTGLLAAPLTKGEQWMCSVNATSGADDNFANSTALTISNTPPTMPTMDYPDNNTQTTNLTTEVSCSDSTDIWDNDTINYEFYVDNFDPPTTLMQNSTTAIYNFTATDNETYYWRCRANDGQDTSSYTDGYNFAVDTSIIRSINVTFNYSAYETASENIMVNINFNNISISTINSATLTYDGTGYGATREIIEEDTVQFNYQINVPLVAASPTNKTFSWDFILSYMNGSTETISSQNYNQTISHIEYVFRDYLTGFPVNCTVSYLNLTARDEVYDNNTNYLIPTSTFTYSLTEGGAITRTYTYNNETEKPQNHFCFAPVDRAVYVNAVVKYEAAGYPQRTYNKDLALTNLTTTDIMYLLSSAEGIYVTFQILNAADQPLSNVYSKAEKLIGGSYALVESMDSDDAGTSTFWLDPNQAYRFTFSKTGYDIYTTTLSPTQSFYTITLGSASNVTEYNYNLGINYTIEPNITVLNNNTVYNFTFDITSSYFSLNNSGFTLTNNNSDALGSATCTEDTACSSSLEANTVNYEYIIMDYYWTVNDNTLNYSRRWYVKETYEGESSFARAFRDLEKLGSGFGNFEKALFAIFIILVITGLTSYVSGIYSPVAILGLVFACVGFLDYVGFIPAIGLIPHFITLLTGLIFMGYAFYEYAR